jgi:hypothetical protein
LAVVAALITVPDAAIRQQQWKLVIHFSVEIVIHFSEEKAAMFMP